MRGNLIHSKFIVKTKKEYFHIFECIWIVVISTVSKSCLSDFVACFFFVSLFFSFLQFVYVEFKTHLTRWCVSVHL